MDFSSLNSFAPCLMGIVNVTPDSFSDTGRHLDADAAAAHARKLVAEGARIVDLGAEASSFFRPGVVAVPAEEQIRRLVPVLERLRDLPAGVVISVDTRSAAVARAVIAAGAGIINDISGGMQDAEMLRVVADSPTGIILMDLNPFFPATPAKDDPDIIATVRDRLHGSFDRALAAGLSAPRIALDPGVGFGRTMADNWRLALRSREVLPIAGMMLLLGASRKRFLETAPPADVPLPANWNDLLAQLGANAAHPRDAASAALAAIAAADGVPIHRIHNVGLAAHAIGIFRTASTSQS